MGEVSVKSLSSMFSISGEEGVVSKLLKYSPKAQLICLKLYTALAVYPPSAITYMTKSNV